MDFTIHPDVQLLSMAVGLLLPLLTGIVVKLRADSGVKAVANAVLAAVTGIVATALQSPSEGIPVAETCYAILFAFVSSAASFHSIWRPTGISTAVQESTKTLGIG